MKQTIFKILIGIVLLIPSFICGLIGMFGIVIEIPLFIILKPKYKLPHDKAWADVVPVSNYCMSLYEKYFKYILNY